MKKVNLYNTFIDSVSYKRNDGTYLKSVKEGDLWVIDTTFVVDVFDVINPAVNIYQDGTLVASVSEDENPILENQASWDTIYVEAGANLTYVDITTKGRPNKRVWTVNGGAFVGNATDSAAVVKYFSLGNYTSSILSSRTGSVPLGQTSKLIPMIVKVIPSSQPFVAIAGSFKENEDETISFNVSGEIASITGETGNFTVHVENIPAGFSKDIAVTSVTKNSDDATKIDLKLAEPIYNTDVITVSYAGGNIKSVDLRTLNAFAASLPVEMSLGSNILDSDWAGFETVSTNIRGAFCDGYWAAKANDDGTFQRTEEKAYSGTACMRYASVDGFAIKRTLMGNNFLTGLPIPAGQYLVSMMIFLDEANTMAKIVTSIGTPYQELTWDLTGVERGKWVNLKQVVITTGDAAGKYNLIVDPADNPGVTTDQKFYIDDYAFIPLEIRP